MFILTQEPLRQTELFLGSTSMQIPSMSKATSVPAYQLLPFITGILHFHYIIIRFSFLAFPKHDCWWSRNTMPCLLVSPYHMLCLWPLHHHAMPTGRSIQHVMPSGHFITVPCLYWLLHMPCLLVVAILPYAMLTGRAKSPCLAY